MTLHLIRLDILLYCLSSMEERVPTRTGCGDPCTFFTDDEIKLIRRIAEHPRSPHGSVVELAGRIGRGVGSLRCIICRVRKGRVPKYWGGVKSVEKGRMGLAGAEK